MKKEYKEKLKELEEYIKKKGEEIEWFTSFLNTLDIDEIKSLMKSNRFSWDTRKFVNHRYLPQRIIIDSIPLIAIVSTCKIIMNLIENRN